MLYWQWESLEMFINKSNQTCRQHGELLRVRVYLLAEYATEPLSDVVIYLHVHSTHTRTHTL